MNRIIRESFFGVTFLALFLLFLISSLYFIKTGTGLVSAIAPKLSSDPFAPVVLPHKPEPRYAPQQNDEITGLIAPFVMPVVLFASCAVLAWLVWSYQKAEAERKKRYLETVDFTKLPKDGPRSGFVGLVAETTVKAFSDLDKLQMHTLVAGASGSGKTVAAQVLAEEALRKGAGVILFDPTAQWTGFLRAQKNARMLSLFGQFGMKKFEARAFPGNIVYVTDPGMEINIKKYMKPGEVTVFVLTKLQIKPPTNPDGKLSPSPLELFIANTVQRIFDANLDESPKLRLLVVYDEVHRLLPKFGGAGLGFTYIERGAREFRKWGVGLVLISQVLSDFVGEIKANIGTEVQMRTKYEGDLQRIEFKFGSDALRSVVKASIGTGMVHSAEYNNGMPYFVTFRPLLHDVVRLSDDELAKYKSYSEKIEGLERRIESLKKAGGLDVFDMELELDLAKEKLKKGSFNLVDIYLESLDQQVGKAGIAKGL